MWCVVCVVCGKTDYTATLKVFRVSVLSVAIRMFKDIAGKVWSL